MPIPTVAGLETPLQGRAAVWSRRAFLAALVAFVLAGLLGFLGVRTATGHASQGGWSVSVRHAEVARSGLDVPWHVVVRRSGGFDDDVTLAVTGDYFDIFETQGFVPEPSDETRDGATRYLTFARPPGDTLVVDFDAYVQPSAQRGRSGSVAVVDDGRRVATVDFSTTLLP